MQQVVDGDEFVGHMGAAARLALDLVDPAHQALVEVGIAADGREHLLPSLEQARQNVVDIADGEGIIGTVVLDRALLTGASAVPGLLLRVILAAEQDVLSVVAPRHQHQHRFRLEETAEIEEVAVLAVGVLDIAIADALRCRRQDGDIALADHFHQLVAAALEFVRIHQWVVPGWAGGTGATGLSSSLR